MNRQVKNWSWFLLIMVMILGLGIYLGKSRRPEPGGSLRYSIDPFREVDPSRIGYRERLPIHASLEDLSALALDGDGNLYVAGRDAVLIYPGDHRIAIAGTPTCLAVDADATLYIGLTNRIETVSRAGERASIAVPSERAYLTSLAVDAAYIYAADAGSRKVWRFSRDGGEPFEIGHEDVQGQRGFYVPSPYFDLARTTDGSIWVVNPGYHALVHYAADGTFLSEWENSSMGIEGFSGCCNPSHVALLPDGGFVTSEKGLPRVKVHNADGSLRCVVAAPDQFDNGVHGLDLAVDARGRIYVLDPARSEIRMFEVKP